MTNTITDGAVPLSRRKDKPLRQRDVAWLLADGYRWYCRYCDTPHKTRDGERCCKAMVLDSLLTGTQISDVPINSTQKRKTPEEAWRVMALHLLEGLYKDAGRCIIAQDRRQLIDLLHDYRDSPACEIVRMRLNMTFEEQIKPLMDWQWGDGVPENVGELLMPRKQPKRQKQEPDGA